MKKSANFKVKKNKHFIVFLIFFACIFMNSSVSKADEDNIYELKVFETSDIHGTIAYIEEGVTEYRLAFIADKINDARGTGDDYSTDKTILIDSGDIYQGNVISNLLKGQPLSAAYDYMQYDAVGVGNHEFDWDIETTVDSDKTMRDYSFGNYTGVNSTPLLACNLYKNGEKVSFADDYIILDKVATDKNGNEINVRVAVIGFCDDYSTTIAATKYKNLGYSTDTDISIAEGIAKNLEESGMCDATILLFHGSAKEIVETLSADSAIDLVLGGHTHVPQNGVSENGVEYLQPGNNALYYADASLGFKIEDEKVSFVDTVYRYYERTTGDRNKLYDLPENVDELDRDIINITNDAIGQVQTILEKEIGYITITAEKNDCIDGSGDRSTTMGNWMASIVKRIGDADVGFINKGSVRKTIKCLDGKTEIKYSDVYEVFPFDDTCYCYEVTYGDFYDLLVYSLARVGKGLVTRMYGINCYFTGTTVNAIETTDGNVIYVDGKWKGDWKDRKLKVATNEFSATTNRTDEEHPVNPFYAWNSTDRLIDNNDVIKDNAIEVLEKEAKENDGFLFVDDKTYYLASEKEDPFWYITADGVLTIETGLKEIPEDKFKAYNDQKKIVYEGTSQEWYKLPISDKWLIESKDVDIECSDKTIKAASYMCVNYSKHSWDDPVYTWSADNKTVTAVHKCGICEESETETADVRSEVTKKPTKTKSGIRTYSADFTNLSFESQKKTEKIPATGQDDEDEEDSTEKTTESTTESTEESKSDNAVVVSPKTSKSPATADDTPIIFVIVIMISTALAMSLIIRRIRSTR